MVERQRQLSQQQVISKIYRLLGITEACGAKSDNRENSSNNSRQIGKQSKKKRDKRAERNNVYVV
jgi:hypothetical protein